MTRTGSASVDSDAFDARFRAYALKHFEIHAAQRMQAFRYFIGIASALVAGMVYAWETAVDSPVLSCVLGGLVCAVSAVFWALDYRTKNLIEVARQALVYLDEGLGQQHGEPHPLALISRDFHLRKKSCFRFVSYKNCFRVVFVLMIVTGLVPMLATVWS